MNNLIDKYKYFDLNYDDYCLLGISTPLKKQEGCSNNDIVKSFLYTYSFLGLNALDIHSIETLKKLLLNKLNSLKHINELDFEQKWWSLAISYLQIGADYHKFDFFSATCETILDSIHTISSKEINLYCNSINDSLSCLIGYELRIRPHMDKQSDAEISPLYSNLISHHTEIINIFKKYISSQELMSKDITREVTLITNIGVKYDIWNIIFDIFVGQMVSQINFDAPFEFVSEKDSLMNTIELSILNISEDSDFMPKEISTVSELISNLLITS